MSFDGSMLRVPLSALLGIRPGMLISVHNAPEGFMDCLLPLPDGAAVMDSAKLGIDCAVFFTKRKVEVVERLPTLARGLSATGGVWVVFPHALEGLHVPNEEFVRLAALELGLRDDRKLVLDPHWTGLRIVWRPSSARPEKPQVQA
jgi:hypothetical protein